MPWEVLAENGIRLPQLGWHLDATHAVPHAIVTHAHADHIGRHREVICTTATARLLQHRLGGRRVLRELPFGQCEPLTLDCTVSLHPAGHILGSAQVLLEHAAYGRLLYTGDFKLRGGLAAEACATPRADLLIMETTFGLPRYVMPPAEETAAAIVAFCEEALAGGATPVLYAYTLGKTQELLRLLGGAGLGVMLHPQAFQLTRLYEQLGESMPAYAEFEPKHHAGRVVISPPGAPLLDWINPKRTAAVTGWALDPATRYRYGCDAMFPLSDHSDFNELLAFVERVQPRLVYTTHGFAREFAATLRARGVEAWALGKVNQMELSL
jgi:Cft2 family RNA processing exonuclease